MNTPLQYLKSVAIILTILFLSSCGMTPAEKRAQKELIAKQEKQLKAAKAKSFYSNFSDKFYWHKSSQFPEEYKRFNYQRFGKKHIDFNEEFLWERSAIKRHWADATNNCKKSTLSGLKNWRLPSVAEAKKWLE